LAGKLIKQINFTSRQLLEKLIGRALCEDNQQLLISLYLQACLAGKLIKQLAQNARAEKYIKQLWKQLCEQKCSNCVSKSKTSSMCKDWNKSSADAVCLEAVKKYEAQQSTSRPSGANWNKSSADAVCLEAVKKYEAQQSTSRTSGASGQTNSWVPRNWSCRKADAMCEEAVKQNHRKQC